MLKSTLEFVGLVWCAPEMRGDRDAIRIALWAINLILTETVIVRTLTAVINTA